MIISYNYCWLCLFRKVIIFLSPSNVRLKCFYEISIWLQNSWYTQVAQLPVNTREVDSNAMLSNYSGNNTFDNIIKYFTDSVEESIDIENEKKWKKENFNKSNKKSSWKSLYRGPSEETFFVLLHTLKAFANQITYLLSIKKLRIF